MKTPLITFVIMLGLMMPTLKAQEIIPLDTSHWTIQAQTYLFEHYKGKDAIYMKGGIAILKDSDFLNGTIEFDVFLTERQAFPGIRFRAFDRQNMESFFLRPHLSGKPDANQAAPVINGITAFQFYFGPSYSFPYKYKYDDWTHVKVVIKGRQAQAYLDYSESPHLSWNLVHEPKSGQIGFGGGGAAMHYANFKVYKNIGEIKDFKVAKREAMDNLVSEWQISDMFEEKLLQDPASLESLISDRSWQGKIQVEEGIAANIARQQILYNGEPGNTVFAKITINSDVDQIKLFEFGYSDRVVAILNGEPIYRGNNKWRSRDYRYLGTIGLFDAIYLDLKKGENTLLFAVSEDFGGWLITGRFADNTQLKIIK